MPDFHQPILLPTLHHLAESSLDEREALLKEASIKKPIALLIPVHHSELEREALPRMLKQLDQVPYVSRLVFSMNGVEPEDWKKTRSFFRRRLKQTDHMVLWNDGPTLGEIHNALRKLTGIKYDHGKGSNVWMGIGCLKAIGHQGVIACHDADILSYDREMLWRLCLPVTHPDMGYIFAKSYYGRVRERIYGRVTRLLVFPLLQALRELFGSTPLLRYLAMFRYPLSGEFAADTTFLGKLSIAPDWGLEIGMLCDVFHEAPSQSICQVDLGSNYDHKHQHLNYDPETGEPDARSGLMRMAREVIKTLLTHLWEQLGFSAEVRKLDRLAEAYEETAEVLLRRYAHEALFNGLVHSMKEEKQAVVVFTKMIRQQVTESHKQREIVNKALPAWGPLFDAEPELRDLVVDALVDDG